MTTERSVMDAIKRHVLEEALEDWVEPGQLPDIVSYHLDEVPCYDPGFGGRMSQANLDRIREVSAQAIYELVDEGLLVAGFFGGTGTVEFRSVPPEALANRVSEMLKHFFNAWSLAHNGPVFDLTRRGEEAARKAGERD